MVESDLVIAERIAIAALVGLATGLEREWSGHASGPDARFAGLRTFFLLGLLGGMAGVFGDGAQLGVATALVLGGVALSVAAYVMAVMRAGTGIDGTTEAAALVVVGLGVLAGVGSIGVAAGAGAVVVLMLREKTRLHWLVQKLDEPELRAGVQFAVLAVVILPLLPRGPFLGRLAIEPRTLWWIVLLFSGLNFADYLGRRFVGPNRAAGITGALGGVISSTAVTLGFSRRSRSDVELGAPLALGVVAACTVLVPRILLVSAVLNTSVALSLLPMLVPVFLVGAAFVGIGSRFGTGTKSIAQEPVTNPLRLATAIRMAVAFQLAILLIMYVRELWGTHGVYPTAAVLGLTDMDALTVSMSRPQTALSPDIAARAIAIGVLANTGLKFVIASTIGRSTYRRRATLGLATLAVGSVIGLLLA